MYSRIQVKYRELRLQEVTAEHRRYKASVRSNQRKADKEEQSREMRIRQLERRCNVTSSTCSQWRLKTKLAEKTGNKKKRRSELLNKGLDQIFTPMQLRVIRTGKKPRWTEEDIRRAIELKKLVTRRGYAFIRNTMKIPLPSPMIMRRGANRFEALKPLYEQMVATNLLKYSTKRSQRSRSRMITRMKSCCIRAISRWTCECRRGRPWPRQLRQRNLRQQSPHSESRSNAVRSARQLRSHWRWRFRKWVQWGRRSPPAQRRRRGSAEAVSPGVVGRTA